jgi:hypothetical protein
MSGDLNIVIGAQDKASKILEDVSKNSQLMAKNVTQGSKEAAAASGGLSLSFLGLTKAAGVLGAGFAAFKGLASLGSFFAESVAGIDAANEATRKLSLAIELNGEDASKSMESHIALTEALEKELNVDADAVTGLMAQAAAMGVADDQLDAMAQTAIGLSETLGVSLEEGLQKARLATEGNFKAFEKLIPSMKDMTSNSEKLSAVIALSEKGLQQKADAAGTAAQADERAGFAMGKLMDSIGAVISPLRVLVLDGFGAIATVLNDSFGPSLETAASILSGFQQAIASIMPAVVSSISNSFAVLVEVVDALFGPAIENAGSFFDSFADSVVETVAWLSDQFIASITFIEVAWNNLGSVFEIAGTSILLSLETMRADIEQLFTVVLPQYGMWFANNFTRILIDFAANTLTLFENLASAVAESIGLIWQFITGGIDFSELMSGLGKQAGQSFTDGFISTTDPLPQIAERAMTDTEKILQQSLTATTTSLVDEFQTKVADRVGRVQRDIKQKPIKQEINLDLTKTGALADASKGAKSELNVQETRLLTMGDAQDFGQQQLQAVRESNVQLQTITTQLAPVAASLTGLVPGLGVLAGLMGTVAANTGAEAEGVG